MRTGKSLAAASIQILDPAAGSLVTLVTTLSWLPFESANEVDLYKMAVSF